MKTSSIWNLRSIVCKIMIGMIFALTFGSMDVAPAIGKEYKKYKVKHDNRRYDNRGRGHDSYRYVNGRRVYYQSYGYRERVYVQPEVIYEPPPPPGISIFFPSIYIGP